MNKDKLNEPRSRHEWKDFILTNSKLISIYGISTLIVTTIELIILLSIKYIPILLIFGIASTFLWIIMLLKQRTFHKEKLTFALKTIISQTEMNCDCKIKNKEDASYCKYYGKLMIDEKSFDRSE